VWTHQHELQCWESLRAWRAAGEDRQRLRNQMLSRLMLPHVARWTQAHFGRLRIRFVEDSQCLDAQQNVLIAVTGRLLQNNERELCKMAELPRPQPLAPGDPDDNDDGRVLDDDGGAQIPHSELIPIPIPSDAADDQETLTGTPIRQRLFRLKSLCVYDCLRQRRLRYLDRPDEDRAATTLMSAGVRAESHSLSFLRDEPGDSGFFSVDQLVRFKHAMDRDLPAKIDALVSAWPSDRRRCYLAWIEGLTPKEIALDLRMGITAVRRHLDTARSAIDKLVDKEMTLPSASNGGP